VIRRQSEWIFWSSAILIAIGTVLFLTGLHYENIGAPLFELSLAGWFGISVIIAGAILFFYSLYRLSGHRKISDPRTVLMLAGIVLFNADLFLANSLLASALLIVVGLSLFVYAYIVDDLQTER
jgi:hypothetical protein